jgi:Glycosyltransferase
VAVAPNRFGAETERGLLEALGAGIPVVTTSEALNSLPLQHGREVYVEGDPAGFSERLIELLQKPMLREAMATRGRAFIRLNHSSAAATNRLSHIIATVANGGHGRDVAHGRSAGVQA